MKKRKYNLAHHAADNRRWYQNHKKMANYSRYKSNSRSFIRRFASLDDLKMIINLAKKQITKKKQSK